MQSEQRRARRFALQLPVTVKSAEGEQKHAETRDVSHRGISCYVERSVAVGSSIEFTLTVPEELTDTETTHIRCTGKVVRVTVQSASRVEIAALIEHYELLPHQ